MREKSLLSIDRLIALHCINAQKPQLPHMQNGSVYTYMKSNPILPGYSSLTINTVGYRVLAWRRVYTYES
jgi:hypothetical protein